MENKKKIELAHLCKFCYDVPPKSERAIKYDIEQINGLSYIVVSRIWDEETSLEGYILKRATIPALEVYIVFKGSVEFQDWIINSMVRKKEVPFMGFRGLKVKAHRGYLKCYLRIREKLIREIKELGTKYTNTTIYYSGHSLGGAIATLAISDVELMRGTEYYHESFGSPAIFSRNILSFGRMKEKINRTVNGNDIVPRLDIFGYTHIGKEHKIGKDRFFVRSFKDHSIEEYIKNLEN
jgi:hypothetical protein